MKDQCHCKSDNEAHYSSEFFRWMKIQKSLKDGYNICSKIIHGKYKKKDDEQANDKEIIAEFEDICLKAIEKFMRIGRFYTLNDWEKLIFDKE